MGKFAPPKMLFLDVSEESKILDFFSSDFFFMMIFLLDEIILYLFLIWRVDFDRVFLFLL